MIRVTGPLRIWTGTEGSSHFMIIPPGMAGEIRAQALMVRRGFGSVRVAATVDELTWHTSVFPSKDHSFFLPVKMDVLRQTGIAAGDDVTVTLELL